MVAPWLGCIWPCIYPILRVRCSHRDMLVLDAPRTPHSSVLGLTAVVPGRDLASPGTGIQRANVPTVPRNPGDTHLSDFGVLQAAPDRHQTRDGMRTPPNSTPVSPEQSPTSPRSVAMHAVSRDRVLVRQRLWDSRYRGRPESGGCTSREASAQKQRTRSAVAAGGKVACIAKRACFAPSGRLVAGMTATAGGWA